MTKVPCVAGSNISTSREITRRILGEETFARGLAALSPADREAYLHSTAVSWVPIDAVDRAVIAMAEAAGLMPERLVVDITRTAQEQLLNTLFRLLLRITTDEALISKTQTFYGKVYDTGRLSSVFPEPGRALVTLHDFPSISDLQIIALGAGVETTLRCAGRKDARATGRRAQDGAVYTCTWKR